MCFPQLLSHPKRLPLSRPNIKSDICISICLIRWNTISILLSYYSSPNTYFTTPSCTPPITTIPVSSSPLTQLQTVRELHSSGDPSLKNSTGTSPGPNIIDDRHTITAYITYLLTISTILLQLCFVTLIVVRVSWCSRCSNSRSPTIKPRPTKFNHCNGPNSNTPKSKSKSIPGPHSK